MLRLQGINPHSIHNIQSSSERGHLVGNSMSSNVLERILFSMFSFVGIIHSFKLDRWITLPISDLLWKSCTKYIDRPHSSGSSGPAPAGAVRNEVRIVAQIARCIIDSGASDHIISRRYLTNKELKNLIHLRRSPIPMFFQTANHSTGANEVV